MSFRTVERVTRSTKPTTEWAERTKRRMRFASHRVGNGHVLVIWLGSEWAKQIGLVENRHMAHFMVDTDFPNVRRAALTVHPSGEFRAARRGTAYGIHLNVDTFAALFPETTFWHEVSEDTINVVEGMLQFDIPVGRKWDAADEARVRAIRAARGAAA